MKNGFFFPKGGGVDEANGLGKRKILPPKSCKAFNTHTHTNVFVYIYKKENKIQPAG
jgi:hypothetical protein